MSDSKKQQILADKSRKHTSRRKRFIIIAIFVILFIGGAVSSYLFLYVQKVSKPIMSDADISKIINDSVKLANNGKVDEADKAYDDVVAKITDPYQKSILLSSEASNYFNKDDYDKALTITKEAYDLNQNELTASFLARIYEAKGDIQNAIYYYRKAIELIDQADPLSDSNIQHYQNMINILNKKKQ